MWEAVLQPSRRTRAVSELESSLPGSLLLWSMSRSQFCSWVSIDCFFPPTPSLIPYSELWHFLKMVPFMLQLSLPILPDLMAQLLSFKASHTCQPQLLFSPLFLSPNSSPIFIPSICYYVHLLLAHKPFSWIQIWFICLTANSRSLSHLV